MRRVFAVLVFVLGLAAPMTALAQVDGGGIDANDTDAAAGPDAAASADARSDFRPAFDDKEGCDCRTAGAGSGAGLAVLAGTVALALRRRRPSTSSG